MGFFQVNFSAWDNGATFVVLCGWLPLCALACQVSGQQFQLTHPKLGRQHSTASLFLTLSLEAWELSMTIVKLNRHRLWGCFSFWAPTVRPKQPTRRTDRQTEEPTNWPTSNLSTSCVFRIFCCCLSCCCLLLLLVKYVLRILRCRQLFVCPSFRLSAAAYFAF